MKETAELPEVVSLICDRPSCPNIGEKWVVVHAGRSTETILCSTHENSPLKNVIKWGRPVAPKRQGPPARGVDEDRLLGLKQD